MKDDRHQLLPHIIFRAIFLFDINYHRRFVPVLVSSAQEISVRTNALRTYAKEAIEAPNRLTRAGYSLNWGGGGGGRGGVCTIRRNAVKPTN